MRWTHARTVASLLPVLVLAALIAVPAPPASAATLRGTIVEIATRELADTSRNYEAGSNCTWYGGNTDIEYGPLCDSSRPGWRGGTWDYKWCAIFTRYVWRTAGVPSLPNTYPTFAYSFATYGARHGTLHLPGSGYEPQPGDAIVFDWPDPENGEPLEPVDLSTIATMGHERAKDIDHVGIVTSYDRGTASVHTVEGNVSSGQGRPDGVHRRDYTYNPTFTTHGTIRGFIEPYGADAPLLYKTMRPPH